MTLDEILTADLAELGRFIASRTGNTEAAAIARSSAPQLRYDDQAIKTLMDPQARGMFSPEELGALIRRIDNQARRLAMWRAWGLVYGTKPSVEDLENWEADGGAEAVDGCWVEPDGVCEHGAPSWLLVLGLI